MSDKAAGFARLRAYLRFLLAVVFYFAARATAQRVAQTVANAPWQPLLDQATLLLFLIAGYRVLASFAAPAGQPRVAQGWQRRDGFTREAATGIALGWTAAIVCAASLALFGGVAITLNGSASAWGWLLADLLFFALLTAAEETAFRGYAFQKLEQAIGANGAGFTMAALFAVAQSMRPGSSRLSFVVSLALGLLLSTVYLRTRALWMSWGVNFAWKASRALLFGFIVAGDSAHSPVVQGDPMGSYWLTGGGFGLDGSWLSLVVLLILWPVAYRLTRDLDFVHNAPIIIPGGMAVNLDAPAQKMHDDAMKNAAPAAPPLVQILPATPLPAAPTIPLPSAPVEPPTPQA